MNPSANPKYFFSYSRKDTDFVLRLATDLRNRGADLWIDQLDIVGGQRWDRSVDHALKACHGMILVLSQDSLASDNVMDEVSFALEEKKRVVPVLVRPCEIPFRLRRVQHVDFTSNYDSALTRLVEALGIAERGTLKSVVEREQATASTNISSHPGVVSGARSEPAPAADGPARPTFPSAAGYRAVLAGGGMGFFATLVLVVAMGWKNLASGDYVFGVVWVLMGTVIGALCATGRDTRRLSAISGVVLGLVMEASLLFDESGRSTFDHAVWMLLWGTIGAFLGAVIGAAGTWFRRSVAGKAI